MSKLWECVENQRIMELDFSEICILEKIVERETKNLQLQW